MSSGDDNNKPRSILAEQLKAEFKRHRRMTYEEFERAVATGTVATTTTTKTVSTIGDVSSSPPSSGPVEGPPFKDTVEIRHLANNSGFYHLPNPFAGSLLPLVSEAVCDWPGCGPGRGHRTNLDIESDRPTQRLIDAAETQLLQQQQHQHQKLSLASTWLHRLRWTSLGAQYDWSARRYHDYDDAGSPPPPLPPSLAGLSARLVNLLLNSSSSSSTSAASSPTSSFTGQAGIVNYYHAGHSMCFHTDEAEPYREAPLVSLSLGLPAAYLLSDDLLSPPTITPVLLQHGDVVIMTGSSRSANHAVARVYPLRTTTSSNGSSSSSSIDDHHSLPPGCFCSVNGNRECQRPRCRLLHSYLAVTRINVNVRQVLRPGQDWSDLQRWSAATATAC